MNLWSEQKLILLIALNHKVYKHIFHPSEILSYTLQRKINFFRLWHNSASREREKIVFNAIKEWKQILYNKKFCHMSQRIFLPPHFHPKADSPLTFLSLVEWSKSQKSGSEQSVIWNINKLCSWTRSWKGFFYFPFRLMVFLQVILFVLKKCAMISKWTIFLFNQCFYFLMKLRERISQ